MDRKSEMRPWNPVGLCHLAWSCPRAEAAQGYRLGVPLCFPLPQALYCHFHPQSTSWERQLRLEESETQGLKGHGLGVRSSAQFMAPGAKSGCGKES